MVATIILIALNPLRNAVSAFKMDARDGGPSPVQVVVGVLGALCAHLVEVLLFAFGYFFMVSVGTFGTLERNFTNILGDCLYFSLTVYTTLGIGDIEPVGDIRFLTGMEALTGLVLITWTASFMFVQMQKFWDAK